MKPPVLTMRDYMRTVFRRSRVLFMPIFFSAMLIPSLVMVIPPKYRATAVVKRRDLGMITNSSQLVARGTPSVSMNTLREEILAWTSLDRVIRDLKMDVDVNDTRQLQKKYEELRKSITFRALANAPGVDYVEIAVVTRSPSLAKEIANKVAGNYVESSRQTSRFDVQTTVQFFREQMEESLRRLRQTEKELDDFAKQHYSDLPEVKKGYLGRLEKLRTDETTHQLLLTVAKNRLGEIEEQLKDVERMVTSEITSDENPASIDLENALILRTKTLDAWLRTKTPEHPDVVDLKAEIEMIRQQITDMPDRVPGMEREIRNPVFQQLTLDKLSWQQEVRSEEAALRELTAQIAAIQDKVEKVVQEEKHYSDLIRAKAESEENYNGYRKELTAAQNRLQAETGSFGTQVELQQPALEPAEPYRKMDIQMAMMCLVGGVCVGISLVFLTEFSDHSIRSADDAAGALSIPVLCSLSTIDEHATLASEHRLTALMLFLSIIFGAGMVLAVMSLKTYSPLTFQTIQNLF